MATAILPLPLAIPHPPEQISQSKLAGIIELRRQIEALKSQLAEAEGEVKADLEVGACVEPGILKAVLKVTERRTVPWKQVVERELGEAYATRVLAATRPETYVTLMVMA